MSRPLARALAVLGVLLLVSSVVGATASAAPPEPSTRLGLVAQDASTPLGGVFQAQVRIGVSTPGVRLSVSAHQALTSRSAFDRSVGDQGLGAVLAQVVLPVASLAPTPEGNRQVSIGLEAPTGPHDPARLAVHRAGVYPLEIELRDSQDQSLARFVTYLVVVDVGADGRPQPLTSRLGVAWVWPLDARPAMRPDGTTAPSVNAALEPQGRLGRQVAALARRAGVPVTVAPNPDTLDAWVALARNDAGGAAGVADLRAASGSDQVLAGPYVPIDLPSLLHASLGNAADAQFVQGGVAIDRFFGSHIDNLTAVARPVDADALGRLRARGVNQVVVDENAVAASSGRLTSAAPFSIEPAPSLAPTGPVTAVSSDTRLAQLLVSDADPALRAQRFLAGLAITALEQPAATRAVAVVNPDGFDPPAALLDAVLVGLTGHPWLAPMTLSAVFGTVPTVAGDTVRALTAYTPPAPPVSASSYGDAETRLAAFGSLVGPEDPRVARGERFLLSSVSSAWSGTAGSAQAHAELNAVNATVDDFLARIRVPAPGTITLTARSGAIPITFRNDTGQPVRVRVALRSHKLDFPQGSEHTIALPPRSTTVRFEVRSRTSGTFPLELSVRSADGSLSIASGRLKVRSTVVSTVGVGLAVGAAVFLISWWIFEIRRRRRARVRVRAAV